MLKVNTIKYVEVHPTGQPSFVKSKHLKLIDFKGKSVLLIRVDLKVILNLQRANKFYSEHFNLPAGVLPLSPTSAAVVIPAM